MASFILVFVSWINWGLTNKEGFSKENHERLASLYRKLDRNGVKCMLTNHNTELINQLYDGFEITVVPVKRMINCDATNRVGEEVIVTNY